MSDMSVILLSPAPSSSAAIKTAEREAKSEAAHVPNPRKRALTLPLQSSSPTRPKQIKLDADPEADSVQDCVRGEQRGADADAEMTSSAKTGAKVMKEVEDGLLVFRTSKAHRDSDGTLLGFRHPEVKCKTARRPLAPKDTVDQHTKHSQVALHDEAVLHAAIRVFSFVLNRWKMKKAVKLLKTMKAKKAADDATL